MEKDGDTQKTEKRFWIDYEAIEKFNFVIAVFAAVSSIATIGLYWIAKNTLDVSQRAFVFAAKADIVGDAPDLKIALPPHAQIGISVTFKNSGQTVSKHQTTTIGIFLNPSGGIPDGFSYPTNAPSQPILLAPQTETHLFQSISASQLADIKAGKELLFVYGTISYIDVFGNKHRTDYCFQYLGYSLKPNGELEEYLFFNGPAHKITQASRDRGVDAIVFDPDPIHGGKYVIQAKRYTNTVDVSAVRDLCAVVKKEGASRGILVTTSTYGGDAYAFANNEPVTLLNGAELLGLLKKHGYTFRINLQEERRSI